MTEQERNTDLPRGHRRSAILSLAGVQAKYIRDIQGGDRTKAPTPSTLDRVKSVASAMIEATLIRQAQAIPTASTEPGSVPSQITEVTVNDVEA